MMFKLLYKCPTAPGLSTAYQSDSYSEVRLSPLDTKPSIFKSRGLKFKIQKLKFTYPIFLHSYFDVKNSSMIYLKNSTRAVPF